MLQAMFAGVSGMQAHQTKINTIGNNIANVNTVGYKSERVTFEDQLSQTLRSASGPTKGTGGQNPTQVGLGVSLGSIDTIMTQGNLQATGKSTDMALQGNGFFAVTTGKGIEYTRDGAFDLDSTGTLVMPGNGAKLLGYQADRFGNVDTTAPITQASALQIPIGTLTDAKQTENVGVTGNLDAGAALDSTKVDFSGNLDSGATSGTIETTSTVYDVLGNPHTVQTVFSNPVNSPAGPNVPTGATRAWDVTVKVDGSNVYDSTSGKSKIYNVGGNWQFYDSGTSTSSSKITMNGGTTSFSGPKIPGTSGASAFSVDLNYGSLTNNAATSNLQGIADGQTGSSPSWGTSMQIYDSLGVGHLITVKYTHVHLEPNAPAGATGRWDWSATENGLPIGDSTTAGNSPFYFGTTGRIVNGANQSLTIAPTDGSATPLTLKLNSDKLTQLASETNASASSQDGYPVGTLQSFAISPEGVITGIFSSGQSRALGQIAMAAFSNPAGLEKAGNNLLRDSTNSGAPNIGVPNQGGRGKINPGYLEMSNVDLSTEFTNMIVTERGFQANSRIITTVDSLLQEVINLKR